MLTICFENYGMQEKPHILVCPLDWGLGHASRMIPVIDALLKLNCRVTAGASGKPMVMLREEFKDRIDYIVFPGASIRYHAWLPAALNVFLQIPILLFWVYKERRYLSRILDQVQPDMVISDNRYGVRNKRVLSVFVTHQLNIRMPAGFGWAGRILNYFNHRIIRKFDHCLVPDAEDFPGLAGKLSHVNKLPGLLYSGPISRFSSVDLAGLKKPAGKTPENFILVLLSGPEPQRSKLEGLLKSELMDENVVWFRGLPGKEVPAKENDHWIYDHGSRQLMGWFIRESSMVICRSGYTTIMDLCVFGKKAVMIPTPGQTEQEYLARLLEKSGYIESLDQSNLKTLKESIRSARKKPGLPQVKNDLLKEKLRELIRMI